MNNNWLKENLLNLVLTFVSLIAVATLLNYRVQQLEAKVVEYPSAQWFELKFNTIDNTLIEIKECIEKHVEVTTVTKSKEL